MGLKKTVEIEDSRGKRVEVTLSDEGVKVQHKSFKVVPIPTQNLQDALRELGVVWPPIDEPRRPRPLGDRR